MGRFVQLVMGPAGVGKSTYCKTMQEHCANSHRKMHVANLDPAAEYYEYEASFDIRELVCLEDAMDEFGYGPNGGLIYCMEYLMQNSEWLKDELDNFVDDDFVILDCPGQVELYSHLPFMHNLAKQLTMWGYTVVTVYLLDALCVLEPSKFISGCLLSLSCMLQLELPHVNIVTKCDLVNKEELERILECESTTDMYRMHAVHNSRNQHHHRKSKGGGAGATRRLGDVGVGGSEEGDDDDDLFEGEEEEDAEADAAAAAGRHLHAASSTSEPLISGTGAASARFAAAAAASPTGAFSSAGKLRRLTEAIGGVVDDYMMVSFAMMDPSDEDSLAEVLHHVDHAVQFGEDIEPKESAFCGDGDGDGDGGF